MLGQTVPNADNLLLGKGKVYFARLSGGVSTGYRFLGNATALEISTEDETRSVYSSAEAAAPLLKKALIRRTPKLSLTLDEFNRSNLALAFMGNDNTYTQNNTPIVAEILSTAPVKGVHYKTAKRRIGTITVKRGATTIPSPEWTLISAESGLIYLSDTAPTFDGATGNLTIDYTPTTITAADMVDAALASTIEGAVLFVGDPSAGPKWEVEVWKASISPDGGFNLIGDEFAEFKLTAEVLADNANHPTQPYYRAILMP